MSEIKCPHCNTIFKIDENNYIDIVNQVRNTEFDTEIHKRLEEITTQHNNELKLLEEKTISNFDKQLLQKDYYIEKLKLQLDSLGIEKDI